MKKRVRHYKRHLKTRVTFYLNSMVQGTSISRHDFAWDYNYFLKKRDIEWYKRLFRPALGKIAGEITPGYSFLDKNGVQTIYRNFPDVKIILLLRNPIQRDWSALIRNLAREQNNRSLYNS